MAKHLRRLLGALLGLGLGCAHAAQVPPPGSSGSLIWNSSGNWAAGTLSGDCSNSSLTLTCTKVNGVTVSLGGALTTTAGDTLTFNLSGNTTVTLPTTGTLLTTAGSGASLTGITWSQIGSTPTTLTGYGITSPLPVAQGGTAASSASGTALDNISGFSSTGLIARTGTGAYSFTAPGTGVLTALGNTTNASGGVVTSPVANANLANSSTTVNSQSCALGGTCTVTVSIGSGVTGLGSGVAAALGNAVSGSSGTLLETNGSGGSLTGLPTSVSNSDGTLTISPTTGSVVASIALGHANTWSGVQTFSSGDLSATSPALAGTVTGAYTLGGTPSIAATALTGTALPSGIVSSSLTSLGTIGAGVWNGSAIGTQYGGLGANESSATGVVTMSSGATTVTTTPTLTATNVTGIPPHQISLPLNCPSSTSSSSSTAYTCTTSPSFTPANGDLVLWIPGANDATNTTTAPTLNVNSTTAYQIVGNGNTAIIQGDVASAAAQQGIPLEYSTTAAAPCSSHCWMMNSGQRNTWLSTYANASNNALRAFYACNPFTTICRIVDNADSEHTCWLTSTCPYGPQHQQNMWDEATLSIMQRRGYPIYSSGIIGPISVVSTSSLISNGILPGITSCTGTVAQVSLSGVGPQQATGALTGGGTLQMSSGAVCTIGVSTFTATPGGTAGAFNRFKVYCAINSTTGTMTVTISGQSASTACNGTNATPLAQSYTVTNTAGTTALTVAITCTTGTCNLGGWEEIWTTGNAGYAIDGFEANGGANSYWLGGAAGNAAYLKLASGTVALLDIAIGVNDAAGSISSSTVNTNIGTFIANWPAASVLIWSSFAYTGTGSTNYPAIQQGEQQYALTNGYDFLNTIDNASSNTSINYWNGIQNSDTTHPTDMGAGANFQQWWAHINGSEAQSAQTYGVNTTAYTNGYIAYLDGVDTTSTVDSAICYVASMAWCGSRRLVAASGATFQSIFQDGLVGTAVTNVGGNGGVASAGSWGIGSNTTAGTMNPTTTQLSMVVDATNHQMQRPYNVVVLTAAYTNATTGFTAVADATPHTLQFAVNASETMVVECDLIYQAASSGGLMIEWTGPASPTAFATYMTWATSGTGTAPAVIQSYSGLSLSSAVPATGVAVVTASTNYHAHIHAALVNGTTAGTLALLAHSVAAATLTIEPGSECTRQ